jgi:hypothetical protein
MKMVDIYLESVQDEELQEGKIWDATKKLWRDHKGKIIAGTAAAAAGVAGAAAYQGKKVYDKNKAAKHSTATARRRTALDAMHAADKKNNTPMSQAKVGWDQTKSKIKKAGRTIAKKGEAFDKKATAMGNAVGKNINKSLKTSGKYVKDEGGKALKVAGQYYKKKGQQLKNKYDKYQGERTRTNTRANTGANRTSAKNVSAANSGDTDKYGGR